MEKLKLVSSSYVSIDQSHIVANPCDVGKKHVSTSSNDLLAMPCVGFINLGSLADRLPRKCSAQADSTQLMGRPKYLSDRAEE